ncbi:MAG TPA: CPBP family intramembrane glutamic endopeptidase [Gemmataceae bacterium]|nr:CPBP family intramembrane glutamic endopeptidase [Gemmataceae bacterium]
MDNRQQRLWVVLLGAGFEGSFVGLAVLLGLLLGQPPLEHFRWSLTDAGWGVAASVPMLAGALALMRWPVGPLARIKQFTDEVLRPLFAPCTVADLALISLLAGLGEEMCFRGVLQPVFMRWLGPISGLALASALFGLMHPITAAYVVLAALVGVYLGWLYNLSGNLLLVIVAHALYDFVLLVYLQRAPSARG